MKKGIHPDYGYVIYRCPSTNSEFLIRSTKLDGPKADHKGEQLPTITIEICSDNHPFYTGKKGLIDTTGRVEAFNKRFARLRPKKEEKVES